MVTPSLSPAAVTRPADHKGKVDFASEPRASALPLDGQPAPRWPAKLSGPEVAELVSALISAFHTRSALAQMLRIGLDRSLDEIAGPGNLRDTVFEVVTHAEANGIVPALFDAAHAAAPANPEILAIAAKRRA